MDETSYDIAMKFMDENGDAVYAESTLAVDPNDPFMKDFHPITDYKNYSDFFEVESFDFAMNLKPKDAGSGNLSRAATQPGQPAPRTGTTPAGAPGAGAKAKQAGDEFQRWRSATEDEAKKIKFELQFDSFRFSRVIDGASPLFFQNCSRQKPFRSVVLVKRVANTGATKQIHQSLAFMRVEFKEVLLKSLKWSDGELVTEACEFVCESLEFKYRQQQAGGNLLAITPPATWDRKRDTERQRQE